MVHTEFPETFARLKRVFGQNNKAFMVEFSLSYPPIPHMRLGSKMAAGYITLFGHFLYIHVQSRYDGNLIPVFAGLVSSVEELRDIVYSYLSSD